MGFVGHPCIACDQGQRRGDTLLGTLPDLGSSTEHRDVLIKMGTLPLEPGDMALLRRGFAGQAERFNLSLKGVKPEDAGVALPAQKALTDGNGDEGISKADPSSQSQPSLVTPDLLVAPNKEQTW